jgi:hypothetical protein
MMVCFCGRADQSYNPPEYWPVSVVLRPPPGGLNLRTPLRNGHSAVNENPFEAICKDISQQRHSFA